MGVIYFRSLAVLCMVLQIYVATSTEDVDTLMYSLRSGTTTDDVDHTTPAISSSKNLTADRTTLPPSTEYTTEVSSSTGDEDVSDTISTLGDQDDSTQQRRMARRRRAARVEDDDDVVSQLGDTEDDSEEDDEETVMERRRRRRQHKMRMERRRQKRRGDDTESSATTEGTEEDAEPTDDSQERRRRTLDEDIYVSSPVGDNDLENFDGKNIGAIHRPPVGDADQLELSTDVPTTTMDNMGISTDPTTGLSSITMGTSDDPAESPITSFPTTTDSDLIPELTDTTTTTLLPRTTDNDALGVIPSPDTSFGASVGTAEDFPATKENDELDAIPSPEDEMPSPEPTFEALVETDTGFVTTADNDELDSVPSLDTTLGAPVATATVYPTTTRDILELDDVSTTTATQTDFETDDEEDIDESVPTALGGIPVAAPDEISTTTGTPITTESGLALSQSTTVATSMEGSDTDSHPDTYVL